MIFIFQFYLIILFKILHIYLFDSIYCCHQIFLKIVIIIIYLCFFNCRLEINFSNYLILIRNSIVLNFNLIKFYQKLLRGNFSIKFYHFQFMDELYKRRVYFREFEANYRTIIFKSNIHFKKICSFNTNPIAL